MAQQQRTGAELTGAARQEVAGLQAQVAAAKGAAEGAREEARAAAERGAAAQSAQSDAAGAEARVLLARVSELERLDAGLAAELEGAKRVGAEAEEKRKALQV